MVIKVTQWIFVVTFLTAAVLQEASGAKVLCISHQFGSHMLMVHTAAEALIERGHEVYTIFSDKMSVPGDVLAKGFKIIKFHTPEWSDIFGSAAHAKDVFESALGSGTINHAGDSNSACRECYDMDNDTTFMKTLEDHHFDIVITDTFPLCNCLYFIPLTLGIPFIPVLPFINPEITRVPALPSFSPHPHMVLSDKMSFIERIKNTVMVIMTSVPALAPFPGIKDTNLLVKYNKDPTVSSWTQLGRRAALFLVTRGPVVEYVTPFSPNVINVECLTCKPGKDLPPDMAKLIKKYPGVIIVSFGSLIDTLPDDITERFLDAFGRRDELVLWRYRGQFPKQVSNNIRAMKWLPQNDLIAHPKAKLFITHSGNNGQYESVYHGVPMLAFPLFAEQHHNARRIVEKGFGLKADIRTFTVDEVSDKISQLIDTPEYMNRTQKAGQILKSAPMDARETAAFWIEHILQFGSDHLKSHALAMDWYSFYMLDVLITFQIIILAALLVTIGLVRMILKYLFHRKGDKEKLN